MFGTPEFIHIGFNVYLNAESIKKIVLSRAKLLDDLEHPQQGVIYNFDDDYISFIEMGTNHEFRLEGRQFLSVLKEIAPKVRRLLGRDIKTL